MSDSKFSPRLIAGIFVAIFFCLALSFRIIFPYDNVFGSEWIKFTATDPYYHMRIVDNLVHNFPHLNTVDPYLLYPVPVGISMYPFFDYLLAAIIWLAGLGAPTQHTVDIIGVYFPAILGALVVIPTYFIGKALINRWVGVIAAGLIAFSPGEFMGRSIIGQADHHVFEVLCTTVAILFIILAVQAARQKQFSFAHLRNRDWQAVTKPLIYSLLAGIMLAIYMNSWQGALLFVFIFFVYGVIQFIIDYFRGTSSAYLCFISSITFLIALIVTLLFPHDNPQIAALIIALIITVVLGIISQLMMKRGVKAVYYLSALVCAGVVGMVIFYVIDPGLLKSMVSEFRLLNPTAAMRTVEETAPILFPGGNFSFMVVWLNFTTGSILSLISLGIFIYFVVKQGESEKTLLVVWSLIILLITLSQRRFAYYFAVNVAVLTGYLAWLILQFFGFREKAPQPIVMADNASQKVKQKKLPRKDTRTGANSFIRALGVIFVFFLVIFPNIFPARDCAAYPQFAPSDAWCESLDWLRNNTPEPFANSGFYYEQYTTPFQYPETAYGVAAWWDYGYWIARIGHRIPNSNPGQAGAASVAKLFTAQDENSANQITQELNSKYIIVDYDTVNAKFYALPAWAGSSKEKFYEIYYQLQGGKLNPVMLFYPEYYRSLAVRLYNFDGGAVIFQEANVVSYEKGVSSDGVEYKEIINWKTFPSYNEASVYIKTQKSGNYRIVGTDPFVSPVPLDSLKHYNLVYRSQNSVMEPRAGRISEVKIFETK